jgi:hypothetical protein
MSINKIPDAALYTYFTIVMIYVTALRDMA